MNGVAEPGSRAPDFDLPLVGGGRLRLRDLVESGGGVLVFFKDPCPASELVVPRLGPLSRAVEAGGRVFLAIGQETEDSARAFRLRHALPFRVGWEESPYGASVAYGIGTVPTLLVVDVAGRVAERAEGFVKREYMTLGAGIRRALSLERTPPVMVRPEEMPDIKPG